MSCLDKSGHLNLFADRDFDFSKRNKAEHKEAETKEETEKWARKVGIIVGLNDKMEEKDNHWVFGRKSSNAHCSEVNVTSQNTSGIDQLTREKVGTIYFYVFGNRHLHVFSVD